MKYLAALILVSTLATSSLAVAPTPRLELPGVETSQACWCTWNRTRCCEIDFPPFMTCHHSRFCAPDYDEPGVTESR